MIDKINLAVISACVGAVVYMFTNFASAADLKRLEANQIRTELRQLCLKHATVPDDVKPMAAQFILKAKDQLCGVAPDDPRCPLLTVDEICAQ